MSMLLHKLRNLFYEEPSAYTWRGLTRLMEEASDDELPLALEYAAGHLEAWPEPLRTASTLEHEGVPAQTPRWWPLVRHLTVEPVGRLLFRGATRSPPPRLGNPEVLRQLTLLTLDGYPRGCAAQDLTAATHLDGLHTLSLRGVWDSASFTALRGAAHLRSVRQLDLSSVSFGLDQESTPQEPLWDGLQRLKAHLCSKAVVPQLPSMISARHLTSAQITSSQVDDEDLAQIASWLAAAPLESLDLHQNNLSDEACAALFSKGSWGALRSFQWALTGAGDLTAQAMAGLPLWSHAPELGWWSRSGLGAAGMRVLAQIEDMAPQESLNLSACRIGDEGFEALCQAHWVQGAVSLDLAYNELEPESLRHLAARPMPRLTQLHLRQNNSQDSTLEILVGAPWWGQVESLTLSARTFAQDTISDQGLATLADSPGGRGVRHLNLGRVKVTPEGVERLLSSPHWGQLRRLDLASRGRDDRWEALSRRAAARGVKIR